MIYRCWHKKVFSLESLHFLYCLKNYKQPFCYITVIIYFDIFFIYWGQTCKFFCTKLKKTFDLRPFLMFSLTFYLYVFSIYYINQAYICLFYAKNLNTSLLYNCKFFILNIWIKKPIINRTTKKAINTYNRLSSNGASICLNALIGPTSPMIPKPADSLVPAIPSNAPKKPVISALVKIGNKM